MDDVVVRLQREDERDVDVDAGRQRALDGGDALCGGRYLHHEVGAVDPLVEIQRQGDAPFGAVRSLGGNLEADVAVLPVSPVVHGPEDVRGALDVGDGQAQEDVLGIVDTVGEQLADLLVVLRPVGDRLLEDGGIAGHPGDVVLGDHPLELAAGQQVAADVVEPHRLTLAGELLQRIRRHQYSSFAKARAAATMASASMPAAAISSAGVPDPGSLRTARCTTCRGWVSAASASRTAPATPPSG